MKKIFSFLFAILFAVGTTGVFSSCQEDAPEITINITMNNDFSDVVNAINNGTMKQEAAVAALTAAIEKMNGEQNEKMDAIVKAINDLAKTTDAKLAIIEAAMKAQTLALEAKLALLETAIKNIPDYSEKMAAIEAAIKNAPNYTTALEEIKKAIADAEDSFATQLGLLITAVENLPDYGDQLTAIKDAIPTIPNYEDQLAALETALEAIADRLGTGEETIADKLQALSDEIAKITEAVEAGNLSQKEALAQIITLLESGALAGGGSGSGGEGGEGEGDEGESTYQSITITTSKAIGETIAMTVQGELAASEVEGAVIKDSETYGDGLTAYTFELTNQTVTIKQASIAYILCSSNQITSVDLNNSPDLKSLLCYMNAIKGENMTNLVNSLPDRTGKTAGKIIVYASNDSREKNVITKADVAIAKAKNWKVLDWYNNEYEGLTYQSITITTSKAIGETITMTVDGELAASEVEGAVIKDSKTYENGNTEYTFELKNQTVTIKQASIEYILFTNDQITSADFNNSPDLKLLYCYRNAIKGENMTNLVKSLPDRKEKTAGKIIVYAKSDSSEENVITKDDVAIAKAKNWIVLDWYDNEYEGI